ncbi:hypothetical protein ABG768_027311 [Culter alburnus]|uniref:Myb/SANT-like DNA-binding domain-containing protein n=1 Tax=Culter alburnus TaxID=194366 RepID=A0AAW2A5Y2_CULAL
MKDTIDGPFAAYSTPVFTIGQIFSKEMAGNSLAVGRYTYKWRKDQTAQFIHMRAENDHLFTGAKNSASVAWRIILEKMGLLGMVTPYQAKKKWDNLKKKYKDCKCPGTGEGVNGKPTAATWPWFVLMDEVLGQRHSNNSPVLISSIPEDTPGPSSAVDDQDEEEPATFKRKREDELIELIREEITFQQETEQRSAQEHRERIEPAAAPDNRKRDRVDELIDLIREEIKFQRETEERRARESRERMDRLLSLLERMLEKKKI